MEFFSTLKEMPSGALTSIVWEKPRLKTKLSPWSWALNPTPSISNFFSYPSQTPLTIFATIALMVPHIAASFPIRLSLFTSTFNPPSDFEIFTEFGIFISNSPFGPLIKILPSLISAVTFSGNEIIFLPILDIWVLLVL